MNRSREIKRMRGWQVGKKTEDEVSVRDEDKKKRKEWCEKAKVGQRTRRAAIKQVKGEKEVKLPGGESDRPKQKERVRRY